MASSAAISDSSSSSAIHDSWSESSCSSSASSLDELGLDVLFHTREVRLEDRTPPLSVTDNGNKSPESPIEHRDVRPKSRTSKASSFKNKWNKFKKRIKSPKRSLLNGLLNELPDNIIIADQKCPPLQNKKEKKAFYAKNRDQLLTSVIQCEDKISEMYNSKKTASKRGKPYTTTPTEVIIGYMSYKGPEFTLELKGTRIKLADIQLSPDDNNDLRLILNIHSSLALNYTLKPQEDEKIPTVEELLDDSAEGTDAEESSSPPRTFKIALDLNLDNIDIEFDPNARETKYMHTYLNSGIIMKIIKTMTIRGVFQDILSSASDAGYQNNIILRIKNTLLQWIKFDYPVLYPKVAFNICDFEMTPKQASPVTAPSGAEAAPPRRQSSPNKSIRIGALRIDVPENAAQLIQVKPGAEEVVCRLLTHFKKLGLFGVDLFVTEFIPEALRKAVLPNYEEIMKLVENKNIRGSAITVIDFYSKFAGMLSKIPLDRLSMDAQGISCDIVSTDIPVTSTALVPAGLYRTGSLLDEIMFRTWNFAMNAQDAILRKTHSAKHRKRKTKKHFTIEQKTQMLTVKCVKKHCIELEAELKGVVVNYHTGQPLTCKVEGIPLDPKNPSRVLPPPLCVIIKSHPHNTAWPFSGQIAFSSEKDSDQIELSYDIETEKVEAFKKPVMLNVRAMGTLVTPKTINTKQESAISLPQTHTDPTTSPVDNETEEEIQENTEVTIKLPEFIATSPFEDIEIGGQERLSNLSHELLKNLKREIQNVWP